MDPQQQFSIPMDPLFPASSISPIFSTTTTQPPPNHHLPQLPTTPVHTSPPTLAEHPPYKEMITTAIVALNESEGSSKQAISKYIDRVFKNLPTNHSELLTYHMKRLKNSGEIVLFKRSYMLPSRSAQAQPLSNIAATSNGGAAASTLTSYSNSGISGGQNLETVQYDYQNYYDVPVGLNQNENRDSAALPAVPQGVGHALPMVSNITVPPAEGNGGISGSEAMLVSLGLSDGPSVEVTQTKKRRGRPPKSASPGAGVGQGMLESGAGQGMHGLVVQSGPKRRPGRPRKDMSSVSPHAPGVFPVQVPVGAPTELSVAPPAQGDLPVQVPVGATASASSRGRPRGRPKRYADEAAVPVAAPNGTLSGQQPKKRGRKPKNAELLLIASADPVSMVMPNPGDNSGGVMIPQQYTVVSSNGVVSLHPVASNGATQVPSGKRRGRPPGGGRLKKQRKFFGKPVGRPRKNPSGQVKTTNVDNSQSLTVQNLKSKLEFLQSRIKEKVSIIKPTINLETSANAMGALQHLEELATMEF